jgi:hypothetical protein
MILEGFSEGLVIHPEDTLYNWACGTYGGKRNACRVVVMEPDGLRPLERPRNRWENFIRTAMQWCGLGLSTSG